MSSETLRDIKLDDLIDRGTSVPEVTCDELRCDSTGDNLVFRAIVIVRKMQKRHLFVYFLIVSTNRIL